MSLRVSDFDFELPAELIAQAPPEVRGASRLMHLDRASGALGHRTFADLPALLRPDEALLPALWAALKIGVGISLVSYAVIGTGPGRALRRAAATPRTSRSTSPR